LILLHLRERVIAGSRDREIPICRTAFARNDNYTRKPTRATSKRLIRSGKEIVEGEIVEGFNLWGKIVDDFLAKMRLDRRPVGSDF